MACLTERKEVDNLDELGIIGYAAITAIAFFVGFVVKNLPLADKWIPVFTIATGAGLGIMCFFGGVEDFATNIVEAIARGVVSGSAATGIHQIYKQLGEGEKPQDGAQENGEEDTKG